VFYTYAWTATEAFACPRDNCPLVFTLPICGDNAILLLDTQPRDEMTLWWHVAYQGREGYLIPYWPGPSSGYGIASTQKALSAKPTP